MAVGLRAVNLVVGVESMVVARVPMFVVWSEVGEVARMPVAAAGGCIGCRGG